MSSIDTDEFRPLGAKRVLVLSPHPDDESLGCAGSMLLYAAGGTEVYLVLITNGEKLEVDVKNIGEIRKAEAILSSNIIGTREVRFLEFPDGEIGKYKDEIRDKLGDIIDDIHPEVIYAPSPLDVHPDHRSTAEIAIRLRNEYSGIKLAFYEVYQPIRFNALVDIASVIEKKREAILAYQKSLFGVPHIFQQALEGLNRYRSFFSRKEGVYEAFWYVDTALTNSEIVRWMTYDYKDDPAERFLSKLIDTDQFIHELQHAFEVISVKDREIDHLKSALSDLHLELVGRDADLAGVARSFQEIEADNHGLAEKLEELQNDFLALRREADRLRDSLAWRFTERFYLLRDKLLSDDTARRRLYNRMIGYLKKVI